MQVYRFQTPHRQKGAGYLPTIPNCSTGYHEYIKTLLAGPCVFQYTRSDIESTFCTLNDDILTLPYPY